MKNLRCKVIGHSLKTISYGYPANSLYWITIKYCRICGLFIREVDDLFASQRPKKFNVDKHYVNIESEEAMEILKEKNISSTHLIYLMNS